jgi:hypothetical protein
MAHIPRKNADGSPRLNRDGTFTVVYRTLRGGPETSWRCDSVERFRQFCKIEKAAHEAGLPVTPPQQLFDLGGGKAAQEAAQGTEGPVDLAVPSFTLREWLGSYEEPGPFFDHRACAPTTRRNYWQAARRTGPGVLDAPMSELSRQAAVAVMYSLIACPACTARARAGDRTDLLENPRKLSPAEPAWDDECVDEFGASTHVGARYRSTVRVFLAALRTAHSTAMRCGAGRRPIEARCSGIEANPFNDIAIPKYAEVANRHDVKEALSHTELEAWELAAPSWCSAAVPVGSYAMLRPSELEGLERSMIIWPPENGSSEGGLVITKTWHANGELRPYGKNDHATGNPIPLPALAMDALRKHFELNMSTPRPDICSGCAVGERADWDRRGSNPHRRCSFADDAPLWVLPSTGKRASRSYFAIVFARAAKRAGLEKHGYLPTLHMLRMSGAVALLEAGRSLHEVCRMGRWESEATLMRFYNRPRAAAFQDAARALDSVARAGRGLPANGPVGDGELVAVLQARIAHLERREAELLAGGAEPPERGRVHLGYGTSAYTDEELRAAAKDASSRRDLARRLEVSPFSTTEVDRRAERIGVTIPSGRRSGPKGPGGRRQRS